MELSRVAPNPRPTWIVVRGRVGVLFPGRNVRERATSTCIGAGVLVTITGTTILRTNMHTFIAITICALPSCTCWRMPQFRFSLLLALLLVGYSAGSGWTL